jgi:putative transposase
VSALGYCVTSNHVHLLLGVDGEDGALGRFMQSLQGDFAQAYNNRMGRRGAFWSDRYHAVMIDGGEYLWRCMLYIDLNMVRAGAVAHPGEWAWCGHQEMAGIRRRYRVVDLDAVAEAVAPGYSAGEVASAYRERVGDAVRAGRLAREARWTESLAVGGERFIRYVAPRIPNRMAVDQVQEGNLWVAREATSPYGRFSGSKIGSKGSNMAAFTA